jgi:hypothetical protein
MEPSRSAWRVFHGPITRFTIWIELVSKVWVPTGLTDYVGSLTLQVSAVPEPASLSLLGIAVVGLLGRRCKAAR